MPIKILFNGKEENIENEISVLELLKKKNIRPEVVTVELNEKIIDRKDYQTSVIKEGDKLELVYFMGGGSTQFVLQQCSGGSPECKSKDFVRSPFRSETNHHEQGIAYTEPKKKMVCLHYQM